jgi:hypothetical protein
MKRILAVTLLFAATQASAQREKFVPEAKKDPAYAKFQADLTELSKTATPTNTNAAAARALFEKNKLVFKAISQKAGLKAPVTTGAVKRFSAPVNKAKPKADPGFAKFRSIGNNMIRIETPAFDDAWVLKDDHANNGGYPEHSGYNASIGKVGLTVSAALGDCDFSPNASGCRIGFYHDGFLEKFTVPNNNEIIAAEITVDYEYLYTGWDTYSSITGLDMVFRVDDKFFSSEYNSLPVFVNSPFTPPLDRWKKMATLYPLDTIDTEFGEFHAEGQSSFTVRGYVAPGSEFEVRAGFGFPFGTHRGMFGCYHYAEFKLKKITVKYLKTMN